jgi:Flp pilus assembly protein TadG
MRSLPAARDRERGQILVLFTLGLVAIIAMVGLVLDGGGAFAQRRVEQNAADLGALAGANAYMNTSGSVTAKTNAARSAAISATTANGYTDGISAADVSVNVNLLSGGAEVQVGLTSPHNNTFSRIIPGQAKWDVTVTAAAIAGAIDTAVGAAPWIMNIDAFNPNGSPKYDEDNPQAFGEINGDYPVDALDLAWTDYNGSNNVNTNEVDGIIRGTNVVTATMDFDQYIGQHNQGNHTALYPVVDSYLAGTDVPVPIVGPCPNDPSNEGCFKGWAMFHVVSADGGSAKTITGYFLSDFKTLPLTVGECTPAQEAAGSCGVINVSVFGAYTVRLWK